MATATSTAGATVTYTAYAEDAVDGAVAPVCAPASGSTVAPGTTTVTCTATDKAGNAARGTFAVKVTYAWSGVLQPINADGSSVFKQGSTVPVKFTLTGTSAGITDLAAKLSVAPVSNAVAGTEQEAASTAAPDAGTAFRYDGASGQYVFNLSTKALAVGTYQVRIDVGDGTTNAVTISLK